MSRQKVMATQVKLSMLREKQIPIDFQQVVDLLKLFVILCTI